MTACRIRRVTDGMFRAAAHAVAESVTETNLSRGCLFPELERIRDVSLAIAVAISRLAFEQGLAGVDEPSDLRQYIGECMYVPSYVSPASAS